MAQFGKIHFIEGQQGGRFPFCNSLFINDSIKTIVDPGAGREAFSALVSNPSVDVVINTHFHFDHISGNHLFENARIFLNEIEGECFRDRGDIPKRLGMVDFYGAAWTKGWIERISCPDTPQSPYSPQNRHEWWLSTGRLDKTYRWGEVMDFGTTKMEFVGAPGHSAGFCCPYFPEEGVVYTGDIDMTAFGPWCFGADGDIDAFIASAQKISALDADTFITGHEVGILDRQSFCDGVEKFLQVIAKREQRVLGALSQPLTSEELSGLGLIYGHKYLIDDWVRAWDALGIRQILNRLVKAGKIGMSDGKYHLI